MSRAHQEQLVHFLSNMYLVEQMATRLVDAFDSKMEATLAELNPGSSRTGR